MIVAHADWGVRPEKQWVAVARRGARGWSAFAPRRVLDAGPLRRRMHIDEDETAVMGFDFPIGLPRAYATRVGVRNFPDFLWETSRREEWRAFFDVADHREEIGLHRPFYPRTTLPKGSKARDHLTSELGIDFHSLMRRCDRAGVDRPPACSLFWTLGGNQVGKGALAGWRLLQQERRTSLLVWPFDGDLSDLLASDGTVVAETYPAEFARHLGLGRVNGKRKQEVRRRHSDTLLRVANDVGVVLDTQLEAQIRDGFGPRGPAEDQFDSVIGLFGMLNVLEGRREAGNPSDDAATGAVEGWMLGQVAN